MRRLNFAQRPIFSDFRFFNEPEISDSGPTAQEFYVLKKFNDLNRVWTREPWISRRARYPETTDADFPNTKIAIQMFLDLLFLNMWYTYVYQF